MAYKRAGIVGFYQHENTSDLPTAEVVKKITQNVGNLMFRYAVCKDVGEFVPLTTSMDPAEVREKVDIIIMPMANNVNPFFNMGYLAKFVEQCDLPTIVVGLGAQAKLGVNTIKELPDGSKRFLSIIKERSTQIGVRGEFTASILNELGVDNTVVMGCPSNFINKSSNLGEKLKKELDYFKANEANRVAVYSQLGRKNFEEANLATEKMLFDLVKENTYHYVHNFPSEIIEYSRSNKTTSQRWKRNFAKLLAPELTLETFDTVFRQRSMAFTSIESWMEFSYSCDVSIGKRVHGCINTIQAGTFGILIVHDERTKELAQTIGLPYLFADDMNTTEFSSIQSFLEHCVFDANEYDEKRQVLYSRYRKIFDENNVKMCNDLFKVAHQAV